MNILLIILVLIFFALVILCLVSCRRLVNNKCCNCVKTILRKLEGKVMFDSILRALLESYFLVAITTLYAVANVPEKASTEDIIAFSIGLGTLAYLVLFPILQHRFLLKKRLELGEPATKEKYGSLYTNVSHWSRHSLRFTLYFCARRFAFALIIVVLQKSIVQ